MGGQVVHFEIVGADGQELADFYGSLFGWRCDPVETSGGTYQLVDTGAGIGGGIGSWPNVPAYLTFYVRVEDLEASLDHARRLGGEVLMEPREVTPGQRAAMIRDPQGNMVGMLGPEDETS